MSHPVPSHERENEREEDYEFAPRKKNPKAMALHRKVESPIHKSLSKAFGGLHNPKELKRTLKKGKSYRIKHF